MPTGISATPICQSGKKGQRQSVNNDLKLRIYCQSDEKWGQSDNEPWFEIAVATETTRCDVRLPLDNLRCRAAIGINGDNEPFIPLLLSKRVQLPKAWISAVPPVAAETSLGTRTDCPSKPTDRHAS